MPDRRSSFLSDHERAQRDSGREYDRWAHRDADEKPTNERPLRMVTPRMRAAAQGAAKLRKSQWFRRLHRDTEHMWVLASGHSGEKRSFDSYIAVQLRQSSYSHSEIAHALWGKDKEYRVEKQEVYKQAEDRVRQILRLYEKSIQRRLALMKTPRKPQSMNALLVRIALSPAKDLLALRRELREKLKLMTW